jgi:SAM-dependent methyltransferase
LPDFSPTKLNWTREHVNRFWDWLASRDSISTLYFSRVAAGDVIAFAQKHSAIGRDVLDYGCGPGYLLLAMAEGGIVATGADPSARSAAEARKRLEAYPGVSVLELRQGFEALATSAFDTVFFLETVEHLLDAEVDAVFAELLRVLRPGGHLVLTCPYAENLAAAQVMCPACGSIFHPIQHVRSFDEHSLAELLRRQGLRPIVLEPTNVMRKSRLAPARRLWGKLKRERPRNLFAIARKE